MFEYLYGNISYLGIVAILLLSGLGLPVPEELPVVIAGAASAYGQLNPWLAFLACVVGALAGDCLLYVLGYHFGHGALKDHRFFTRFLKPEREKRVEQMILQHGLKVLVLARFMVGIRSAAFLAAGILRLPFRRFIIVDAICATIVIGVSFGLSFLFAPRIHELLTWIRGFGIGFTGLVLLAVAIVGYIYYRRRKNRIARVLERRVSRNLARNSQMGMVPAELSNGQAGHPKLDDHKTVA